MASESAYLLGPMVKICGECHDEAEADSGKTLHEAAESCTDCHQPHGGAQSKFLTNTPPDLCRLYESSVQLYRSQGHMLDVSDLVAKMKGESGGLFETCLTAVQYEGQFYGVPFTINPWPMHARLDVLEEHGLEYPRTWEAFVETCLKVQKPPFYGFGMDLGLTQDATDNIMQVCWCFGGKTVDADGNVAFDNPGNVAGFQFISEMYSEHKIIPKGVVGNGETAWNNKAYQSGQVAFINNPTSVYAYLAGEDPELMKKTGLFGVPAGPVQYHDEVFHDPHVMAREMVVEVDHPAAGRHRTLGTPIKLSGTPGSVYVPVSVAVRFSSMVSPVNVREGATL